MKITKTYIKRKLVKDYGWSNLDNEDQEFLIDELIKDVLLVIDEELKFHKNISIK